MHEGRRGRRHGHEPRPLENGARPPRGDTIARLRTLFPHAVRHTAEPAGLNGFSLVPRRACEEVGGQPYPGLLARIINGRVSALVVRTGVCE